MSNFWQQADIATALDRLSTLAASLGRNWLDEFRHCCSENHLDFYTEIAALILGVDRCDVMAIERAAVKNGLFVYMYSTSADRVTQIQDATIIETRKPFTEVIERLKALFAEVL
jgi:hypothetical protein